MEFYVKSITVLHIPPFCRKRGKKKKRKKVRNYGIEYYTVIDKKFPI